MAQPYACARVVFVGAAVYELQIPDPVAGWTATDSGTEGAMLEAAGALSFTIFMVDENGGPGATGQMRYWFRMP